MDSTGSSQSISGVVTMLTLAVAFGGMFAGVPYWWAAFVVGFGFVLPAVSMLGGSDAAESSSSTQAGAEPEPATDDRRREPSKQDAMETLRERYAQGELSEEQFEAKLERLLETETLENARDTVDRTRRRRVERDRSSVDVDERDDDREPVQEPE
jgi:hypothetical protein